MTDEVLEYRFSDDRILVNRKDNRRRRVPNRKGGQGATDSIHAVSPGLSAMRSDQNDRAAGCIEFLQLGDAGKRLEHVPGPQSCLQVDDPNAAVEPGESASEGRRCVSLDDDDVWAKVGHNGHQSEKRLCGHICEGLAFGLQIDVRIRTETEKRNA